MHHFPRGGNLDRRWGMPVEDPQARITGMQSGDLHVMKAGSLPEAEVDHYMAAQGEAARDAEPYRPMEQGLGELGVAGMQGAAEQAVIPDPGTGPEQAAA